MNSKIVLFLGLVLTIITLSSCLNRIESELSSMLGKQFVCDMERLSSVLNTDAQNIKYKDNYILVIYYDHNECVACHSNRLNNWNKFIKQCKKENIDILYIFSPEQKDVDYLRTNILSQRFKYPVYIDTCEYIKKQNPWIPENSLFHTFLLDYEKKVILVGDPRRNKKLMDLFWTKIKKTNN